MQESISSHDMTKKHHRLHARVPIRHLEKYHAGRDAVTHKMHFVAGPLNFFDLL